MRKGFLGERPTIMSGAHYPSFSHTTAHEIAFVRGLGTFSERGRGPARSRLKLLQDYLAVLDARPDETLGGIDRAKVRAFVENQIAARGWEVRADDIPQRRDGDDENAGGAVKRRGPVDRLSERAVPPADVDDHQNVEPAQQNVEPESDVVASEVVGDREEAEHTPAGEPEGGRNDDHDSTTE